MGFGNNALTILINAKDNASAILAKVRGNIQTNSEVYKNAGKKMMIASAAISAAIGITIHQAAKFEQQMAQVSTMLDKNTMNYMPKFEKSIKKMAIEFGEGTQTLSNGLYDILSASIPPAKAMEVLEVSVKAAKAGLTDAGVAADAITTVLNSYNLSADKAGKVSDLLFAIVKRGKITFAELAPNIGKVASMASKTGMSLEDLGATISTLTRSGIKVEMAMTSVKGVLNKMLNPGAEAAAMFRDRLGVEMSAATLKADGFIGVLTRMKKAGLTPKEIAKMFPNVRALTGIIAVMGNLEGATSDYNFMLNSAGLTQEAFQKNTETTKFELARLKQALIVLSMELGKHLLPAVKKITTAIIGIIKYLNSFSDVTKKMVMIAISLSAGLLGMGGAFLFTLGTIGRSIVGFNTLTTAINGTKAGMLALKMLAKGGFVVGIAAATYSVYRLAKGFYDVCKAAKTSREIIEGSIPIQEKAIDEMVIYFDELLKGTEKLTKKQQEQIKTLGTLIGIHKVLATTDGYTTELRAANLQRILQLYMDYQTAEWEIDTTSLAKKAEIAEAKKEIIYEASEAELEMVRALSEEIEAMDLTSYGKKKALIEKEFSDKKRIYSKESKDIKSMMAYEIKLNQKKQKQLAILDKAELKSKQSIVGRITDMTISSLLTVLEAEGSSTKKRKGLYVALLAMEKALAIARLWSAEASKGVLGIATAIAGTATLTAQFVSITKGMKETKIPNIVSPEIPLRDDINLDDDDSYNNNGESGYSSNKNIVSSGITQKTEINLGGINLNFDVENLGELSPADLDTLMRDFAEAVKAKTLEGLSLAKSIYNAGELLQEEAI